MDDDSWFHKFQKLAGTRLKGMLRLESIMGEGKLNCSDCFAAGG